MISIISITIADGRRAVLREWYHARAKEKILPKVETFAKQLGVEYAKARLAGPSRTDPLLEERFSFKTGKIA